MVSVYLGALQKHVMRLLGGLGIDSLQGHRDKAKLKWWYKLVTMPEDRYPKMLFSQDWNIKPHRGRQRKVWSRLVDDLFLALKVDKADCLKDILDGSTSLKEFQALMGRLALSPSSNLLLSLSLIVSPVKA